MEKVVQTSEVAAGARSSIESRAIYAAFIGGGVGFIVGLLSFWNGNVSLFERGLSLGFVGSILGGIVALVVYLVVSSGESEKRPAGSWWQYAKARISVWSLALVHGLLTFLSYALLFYVVSEAFRDAHIDQWAASVLLALSTGFVAYVIYLSAATMTAVRVSFLLALFLLAGTFISMLTAGNPHWWNTHFSSLGAGGGVSGYAFNATLILAGLVIVALARYITEDFNKLQSGGQISQKAKVGILQTLLTGIGIALAFVGLFIYDQFPTLHNAAAGGMAVLFLIIVVLLPLITPGFTRAFFIASYSLLASLFVAIWLLMGIHYFNLTIFELVAAAIIFIWMVVFVRHVAAMIDDDVVEAQPVAVKPAKEKS